MKKLIVLSVVFALALGLVIGCGDKKPTDNGDVEETPSTRITFGNMYEGDGFSIEYPDDWEISKDFHDYDQLVPCNKDELSIVCINFMTMDSPGISKGDIDLFLENLQSAFADNDSMEIKKVRLGSATAVGTFIKDGLLGDSYNIPLDDKLLTVSSMYDDETKQIVDDILSTFKLK